MKNGIINASHYIVIKNLNQSGVFLTDSKRLKNGNGLQGPNL